MTRNILRKKFLSYPIVLLCILALVFFVVNGTVLASNNGADICLYGYNNVDYEKGFYFASSDGTRSNSLNEVCSEVLVAIWENASANSSQSFCNADGLMKRLAYKKEYDGYVSTSYYKDTTASMCSAHQAWADIDKAARSVALNYIQ